MKPENHQINAFKISEIISAWMRANQANMSVGTETTGEFDDSDSESI